MEFWKWDWKAIGLGAAGFAMSLSPLGIIPLAALAVTGNMTSEIMTGAAVGIGLQIAAMAVGTTLVNVSVGQLIVGAVGAIGLGFNILFTKLSGKDRANDKLSWVNRGMIDPNKSAQQNAEEMLNNKYGVGNWRGGSGSEFSKIVKWIIRHILRK